jgi:hypothetical protein
MGDGEGFTTLILTDAESRLIRQLLETFAAPSNRPEARALAAFNRGVQRGTDKIKAEFDEIQKAKRK